MTATPEVAAGPAARAAVLVLAYGGPQSLEGVEPFLERVLAPQSPSPDMLERARERYRAIGGSSPLTENSVAQAAALEERLNGPSRESVSVALGRPTLVRAFLGMRFSEPSIPTAVESALAFSDPDSVVATVILASHQSDGATGGYVTAARSALAATVGGHRPPSSGERLAFVPQWHTHPRFLDAIAENAAAALEGVHANGDGDTFVLFTAHSLPIDGRAGHGEYEAALTQTAEGVMRRLGALPWRLAYQSRSGRKGVEWLGPDAGEVLHEEASVGRRRVAVVPLGFVSEHLETLYDLDIALAGEAAALGLGFSRAGTVQDHPGFVTALADSVIALWGTRVVMAR